ncbi:MAG: hypothetical protein H3C45_00360 [Bacteroidia bacterium]|nr:hypothetical protein [Bacteroidia bacterium]
MKVANNQFSPIESFSFEKLNNSTPSVIPLIGEDINSELSTAKQKQIKKWSYLGLILIAVGVMFCFAGCIFTFMHDYSSAYVTFSLYGLTLLGTCLILTGLAFTLGF